MEIRILVCISFTKIMRKVEGAKINTNTSSIDTISEDSSTSAEDSQEMSPWKDGISYCTWNGLGWDLKIGRAHV